MKTQNGFTLKQERQLIRETNAAKESQKFRTIDTLMKDLSN